MAGSPVVVRVETAQQGLRSPGKGKPDPTPARAEKGTTSRLYQLKSGHALTGVYLKSTENRPDDHCDPENISGTRQARDHLFKHCYKWKGQQAVMWARVKEAKKGGSRSGAWADERCSPGGPRLLAKPPCQKDSSTGGGELEQRGRSAGGGDGLWGGASRVVTRAHLV